MTETSIPKTCSESGNSFGPSCRLSRYSQITGLSNSFSPPSVISAGTLLKGRVLRLVEAVLRDPFQGEGKPEPLKFYLQGCG